MKKIEDFQQAIKDRNIERFALRKCSMCDTSLYFVFKDGHVFFDSSCGCTYYHSDLHLRRWEELPEYYNYFVRAIQTGKDDDGKEFSNLALDNLKSVKKEWDKVFGFNENI